MLPPRWVDDSSLNENKFSLQLNRFQLQPLRLPGLPKSWDKKPPVWDHSIGPQSSLIHVSYMSVYQLGYSLLLCMFALHFKFWKQVDFFEEKGLLRQTPSMKQPDCSEQQDNRKWNKPLSTGGCSRSPNHLHQDEMHVLHLTLWAGNTPITSISRLGPFCRWKNLYHKSLQL